MTVSLWRTFEHVISQEDSSLRISSSSVSTTTCLSYLKIFEAFVHVVIQQLFHAPWQRRLTRVIRYVSERHLYALMLVELDGRMINVGDCRERL